MTHSGRSNPAVAAEVAFVRGRGADATRLRDVRIAGEWPGIRCTAAAEAKRLNPARRGRQPRTNLHRSSTYPSAITASAGNATTACGNFAVPGGSTAFDPG